MGKPLSKKKTTEVYSKYQNLIYQTAWNFHIKYGKDIDELISTGNYIFCRICHNNEYDVDIATFQTYLVNCIKNKYLNDLKPRADTRGKEEEYQEDFYSCVKSIIDRLPPDIYRWEFIQAFKTHKKPIIRKIYELIMKAESETKMGAGVLYNWLDVKLSKEGYPRKESWSAFKECKTIIKEAV